MPDEPKVEQQTPSPDPQAATGDQPDYAKLYQEERKTRLRLEAEKRTSTDDVALVAKRQDILAKTLAEKDPEFAEAWTAEETATRTKRAEAAIANATKSTSDAIVAMARDIGMTIDQVNENPIFDEMLAHWADAQGAPSDAIRVFHLGKATDAMSQGVRKVQTERHKQELAKVEQEAKAKAKAELNKEAELLDTDLGSGAGGGLPPADDENIDKMWMDWERDPKNRNKVNPYSKQYAQILSRL